MEGLGITAREPGIDSLNHSGPVLADEEVPRQVLQEWVSPLGTNGRGNVVSNLYERSSIPCPKHLAFHRNRVEGVFWPLESMLSKKCAMPTGDDSPNRVLADSAFRCSPEQALERIVWISPWED